MLHAVDSVKNLSPRYRHWIEEKVIYIIQSDERKEFLSLKSDTERENFWQICNPAPRSEINEYKEEHYRRRADANFGNIKAQDGWRTDMKRIYITLRPPEPSA